VRADVLITEGQPWPTDSTLAKAGREVAAEILSWWRGRPEAAIAAVRPMPLARRSGLLRNWRRGSARGGAAAWLAVQVPVGPLTDPQGIVLQPTRPVSELQESESLGRPGW